MATILSAAVMDALFTAINTSLNKGLGTSWDGYQSWSNVITSTGAAEKYPMTIVTGGMREWIGDRVINRLSAKFLTVHNDDFERTEGVNRNHVADDNIGFIAPLFESMGIDAGNLWGRLATEALVKGGKWADGKDFFSASRKLGKATYNNVVAGALDVTNYAAARSQMMAFVGTDGETPMGLVPDTLVVGHSLEGTARKLFSSLLVVEDGAAVDNIYKDQVTVQVNPYITDAKWFLCCTTRGIKPISVQKRQEGALQRWDQESDENVKNLNENHYGVHYRGAAAATCPFLVIGGNLG